MSDVAVAEKPAKNLRKEMPKTLKPGSFMGIEYARAHFHAVIPAEWDFDDVLKPGFWTNVVHLLARKPVTNTPDRTGAIIEVCTEDHAFIAHLYVRAVLASGLVVQCIGPSVDPKTGECCPVDLRTGKPWAGRNEAKPGQLFAKWNPGKKGFDIIRKSDQQVVADGSNLRTREQAEEWIEKTTKAA